MLSFDRFHAAATSAVGVGIALGLVVGKLVGISAGAGLSTRIGGRLPDGVDGRGLVAIGLLGGIGFTVSLFVADLSFTGDTLETAKLAILATSLVAAVAAALTLRSIRPESPVDT